MSLRDLKFKFFIANRYFNKQNQKKINIIFLFMFLSLSIGLAVMIVVLGIMNGFQDNHISRRIEIGSSHINISRADMSVIQNDEKEKIESLLYNIHEIEAAIPYVDKEIVFRVDRAFLSETLVLKLRAFDLEEVIKDSRFMSFFEILAGQLPNEQYGIIIGEPLSQRLSVGVGDYLLLTPDISLSSYKSKGVPYKITGIFKTNSYDYDRYWGFINLESLIPLCGSAKVDNIGVKLSDVKQKKSVLTEVKEQLGEQYCIRTSEEINKGYFAALKLEKVMIVFLFMIIFLMVSINTFGALKLMLSEKKKDISILKALGLNPEDIVTIYTLESVVIGFLGCLVGVMLGIFIAYNIENIFYVVEFVVNCVLSYISYVLEYAIPGIYFPTIKIYDTSIYYQTSFIIKLGLFEIISIGFVIVAMTIISAFVPVYHSSKLKPNEILKS